VQHDTLLKSAQIVRGKIDASANPAINDLRRLLVVSACHVVSAYAGNVLYQNPEVLSPFDIDQASVEIAASPMLAFGSGRASIDLCASSLIRLRGFRPKPDREWDFKELKQRIKKGSVSLTAGEQSWFDDVDAAPEWREFRHAAVHRAVRRDTTVSSGARSSRISATLAKPGTEDSRVTLDRLVTFTEDRWRQFWLALNIE
jgi:hypothetical protein